MITITGLSKNFGQLEVLNDINITFLKGKVYGIIGENGAGKTTLFKCIAGLESHNGRIKSEQTPLKNYLGLLFAEPFFFKRITGREYIQFLCNSRGVDPLDIDKRNIFDLPLDRYATTYSTGMKKKLALTAILMQECDYYILDEPFNGVDIQSNIIITEIISHLRKLNKCVIISSHIFSTLKDSCDYISILSDGKFINTIKKDDFEILEKEYCQFTVGNKIELLGLK